MSSQGAGFPHLELGAERVSTRIGDFEGRLIYGRLEESDFFDSDPDNNFRFISALSFSYAPSFVPGLILGLNRELTAYWKESKDSFFTVYNPFLSGGYGFDQKDQRASLSLGWFFPRVGFNAYLEWACNDYSPRYRYIIRAPGHSQAYTPGFSKILLISGAHGLLGTLFLDPLELYGNLSFCQELNWNFVEDNDHFNLYGVLGLR
jgi:hypothetical protein